MHQNERNPFASDGAAAPNHPGFLWVIQYSSDGIRFHKKRNGKTYDTQPAGRSYRRVPGPQADPCERGGPNLRFVRKVNDRGVLTLPTEIREALGVEEGDIVEFEVLGVVKKTSRAKATRSPASDSNTLGGSA